MVASYHNHYVTAARTRCAGKEWSIRNASLRPLKKRENRTHFQPKKEGRRDEEYRISKDSSRPRSTHTAYQSNHIPTHALPLDSGSRDAGAMAMSALYGPSWSAIGDGAAAGDIAPYTLPVKQ